jgi:hypothetical protein
MDISSLGLLVQGTAFARLGKLPLDNQHLWRPIAAVILGAQRKRSHSASAQRTTNSQRPEIFGQAHSDLASWQ